MKTKGRELIEAVPRRELELFDEMDRVFDSFFHRGWLLPLREVWPQFARVGDVLDFTSPRIDMIDREDEILVRAEIPGVDKKDVQVDLSGPNLSIRGERRREEKVEEGEFVRSEIARGAFRRTIRLPEDLDLDNAKAEFKDGVLEIRLPKTHKTERRQIKVD